MSSKSVEKNSWGWLDTPVEGRSWISGCSKTTCDCNYDNIKFIHKSLNELQGWEKQCCLIIWYYYRRSNVKQILVDEIVKMIILYSQITICFEYFSEIIRKGVKLANNLNNQIIEFIKNKFNNKSMAFISKCPIRVSQEFSVKVGGKVIGFHAGVVSKLNLLKWNEKNVLHKYTMNSLTDVPILDHYLSGSCISYHYNRSLYDVYGDPYHNYDVGRLDRHLKRDDKIKLQVNHKGNFVTYYQNNDRLVSICHFSPVKNFVVKPFYFAISFFNFEFENNNSVRLTIV